MKLKYYETIRVDSSVLIVLDDSSLVILAYFRRFVSSIVPI